MTGFKLSKAEILAIVLMGFIGLVTGGWAIFPLCVLAGVLIGFNQPEARPSLGRAVISGGIASLFVALGIFVHNRFIVGLPKIEAIPPAALNPLWLGLGILVGGLTAFLVVLIRNLPSERGRRFGMIIFVMALAIVYPFYDEQTKLLWLSQVVITLIYALQALGLNIVAGYAGLLDLGYVAFFAIGGYTIALLSSPQFDIKWSFFLVIWIAAAAAAFFGLLLGAPTLPLRGDYLAIVTLGFGEIVPIVFRNLEAVTIYEPISKIVAGITGNPALQNCLLGCDGSPFNITNGIQGISPIEPPRLPGLAANFFNPSDKIPWYFLALTLLLISVFFISRLRNSKLGRAWIAQREDELAASAMGINLVKTKLSAFMIGAMFSGVAGALFGSYVSFISPSAFDFSISVIVLCTVILGGSGNVMGAILGALILRLSDLILLDKVQSVVRGVLEATVLRSSSSIAVTNFLTSILDITQYKLLFFGVILVTMMLVRPEGLMPSVTSKRRSS